MKKLFSIGPGSICLIAVLTGGFHGRVWAENAVSGLNGKLSGLYGDVDGEDAAAFEGSISVPLSRRYGFQADGLIGKIDPEDIHGLGAHLFWRDPKLGLLGLTSSFAAYEDVEVYRTGLESEYYLDQFTFAASLGYQSGDIDGAVYGGLEARFYPIANLALSTAWSRADEDNRYGVGAEWQPPYSWVSIFAELAGGDDDYEHVFGGLRLYIGELKALVLRHREDDPPSRLFHSLTDNLRAAQAEARAQGALASNAVNPQEPATPGGADSDGSGSVPVVDDPVADEPVADDPVVDDPVVNDPVADDPVTDDPVVDDPVADDPVADDPVVDDPVVDDPIIYDPDDDDDDDDDEVKKDKKDRDD